MSSLSYGSSIETKNWAEHKKLDQQLPKLMEEIKWLEDTTLDNFTNFLWSGFVSFLIAASRWIFICHGPFLEDDEVFAMREVFIL